MKENPVNPLARVERRKVNYPLAVAGILLFGSLVVGAIVSARIENWIAVFLFAGAAALFVVVALLDMAKTRRMAAVDDRRFIRWDAANPDIQRQNVNVEVRELARVLKVEDDQLGDLLSAYIVAEDLALRQIQQEENLPLMRHVSIGGTSFDGILVDQDVIKCIEVSFLVVPDVRPEKVEAIQLKFVQAKKKLAEMGSRLKLKLMLVLVTQLTQDEEERLRDTLVKRRFEKNEMFIDGIEISMLDFEMLQKVYVSE